MGLPYVITGGATVGEDATLTIAPGVEVRFERFQGLEVRGRLDALGLATQPIIFTGTNQSAGWWGSIAVTGTVDAPAMARFDHVTIEYGGSSSANLYITNGQVAFHHGTLRFSGRHGVQANGGTRVAIGASQIVGNTDYAVYNGSSAETDIIDATNNWWGAASGPQVDGGCNPGGNGGRLTAGSVMFRPFLTAPDQEIPPGPVPGDALILTLTPTRWFVPADGSTRAWFTITLRDGRGQPVPGRQVYITSGRASVSPVGTTDIRGQALAYATSDQVGSTDFLARLYDKATCEFVHNASASVTFAAPGDYGLLPDSAAPYFTDEIQVSPEPIVVGVPSTIGATLTNPNSFPVTVDVTFSFQGAHIGLPFLPVGEVTGTVIPANSTATVMVVWLPTASGHYCFSIEAIATSPLRAVANRGSSRAQRNVNVQPGQFLGPNAKNAATQAGQATNWIRDAEFARSVVRDRAGIVSGLIQDQLFGNILDFIYDGGAAIACALGGGTSCGGWKGPRLQRPGGSLGSLGGDPPSQDYRSIVSISPIEFNPLQPGPTLPAARADALNRVMTASLDLLNNLFATVVSYDRYAGAAQANDLEWQSLQSSAYLYYLDRAAGALSVAATAIDALLQEIRDEGLVDVSVTADDYRAYQDRLRTQGFTADEIEAGHLVGFNDAALEEIRQRRLARDPASIAGSVLQGWAGLAVALRNAGGALSDPPAFGISAGRSASTAVSQGPAHALVTLFDAQTTIAVGNPSTETETIYLRVRPLDLPDGWMVGVTPRMVTLAPGQQITATVNAIPPRSALQGSKARFAVEGYTESQLLGGVVVDIPVPEYRYPPLTLRR